MTKPTEEKAMPETLAIFAASARNNNVPAGQGVSATPETSGKPETWPPRKKTRRTSSAAMRQGTRIALMRL